MSFPRIVELSQSAISAATTSTEACAVNAARSYLLLVNDSDTTIYAMVGGAASVNQGIRLAANGGSFEMGARFGNLDVRAVNAIHGGTGSKTLLVIEG